MNDPSSVDQALPDERAPRLVSVLVAPMRLFLPAIAAKSLCHARRSAVMVTLALYCVLLAMAILWVTFLGEAGLGATRDSAALVLRGWREAGPLGLAPMVFLLTGVLAPALCLLVALLYLPTTHVQGPVSQTLALNFRAATASAGVFITLFFLLGSIVASMVQLITDTPPSMLVATFIAVLLVPVALIVMIFWLTRAMRVVADLNPRPAQTPRCEGCGYDLSHAPAAGRCTECGLAIADSLGAPHRKPTAWERSAGLGAWFAVNWDVVFHATRFYRALLTREGHAAARGWTILNFVMLFVCAWLWLLALLFREILREGGILFFPQLAATFVIVLAGWAVWRIVALAATIQWLVTGRLDDARRVHKAAAYETAFLWVYSAYCGTLFTSMVLFDDYWISRLVDDYFGSQIRILGMNFEQLALLLGVIVLSIVWWARWQRVLAAIRWANK